MRHSWNFQDLTGKKFNRLKIIRQVKKLKGTYWLCKCDCGNTAMVNASDLKTGHTKSCGCWKTEQSRKRLKTHGMSSDKFYWTWQHIQDRTTNKISKDYKYYGGRGIKCLWKNFIVFKNDMHETYLKHYKQFGKGNTCIERINNDGNYCKENCKWATRAEQSKNRRKWIVNQKRDKTGKFIKLYE